MFIPKTCQCYIDCKLGGGGGEVSHEYTVVTYNPFVLNSFVDHVSSANMFTVSNSNRFSDWGGGGGGGQDIHCMDTRIEVMNTFVLIGL